MNALTLAFLIALAAKLAVETWLGLRHIHYVRAHRDAVPVAFAGIITSEKHALAADYTSTRTRFGILDDWIGTGLLLIWTLGGGLDWLDTLVRGAGFGPVVTGTLFMLVAFLIMGALDIPSSLYSTFVIEKRFGFNRTTARTFVTDLIKQALLLMVIGAPLAAAVLWLMQAMGSLWWLYVWALWMGFALFMTWAYPAVIAPLFNKFTSLDDAAMRERIEGLLTRTGFKSNGVFVMDGSARSAHGNAYFTGFGRTKRIVFFDTLLKQLAGAEVEAVLAHELGHFRLKHVVKRIALMFVTSLAGLAVLGWLIGQPWFYEGLGASQSSTHMALMLFLIAGPVFMFWAQPFAARLSRKHEYEADAYAVQQTDRHALIAALVKLYKENAATLTPDPLHSAFYDSHPPALARIQHLQTVVSS